MILNKEVSLKQLNDRKDNTLLSALGIEYTEIGDDYLIAKMPVDHRTVQPFGILHGGASVALAETVGSMAAFLVLDDPKNKRVVGVDINTNHLKAVTKGWVYGKATPIRLGRKIQVWQIEILDEKENKICISRLTTMVVELSN